MIKEDMIWKTERMFVGKDDPTLQGLTKMLEVLFDVEFTSEFVWILFTFLFDKCEGMSIRQYVEECYYEVVKTSRKPGVWIYITDDPRFPRSISMTRNGKMIGFDKSDSGGIEVSRYEEKAETPATPERPLRIVSSR